WLTIVGLVYTGLALMGWSAPGLTGISRKLALVAFRAYCRKRGVPEAIILTNTFSDSGDLIGRNGELS
ncbi:hypothetical protein, partial [Paracoccus aminovorans]|uniref:hypothetical protein n=1 Tax=Paracoccus aminovorans TaxID=34004 RepID=UPI001C12A4E1